MDKTESFRARLAQAGLEVTEEQAAGIEGGWVNLQQMIAMVRRPRPPEDEPAMIFMPEQD